MVPFHGIRRAARRFVPTALSLGLLALVAAPVHGAVFTVGSDGTCTHGSVLAAVFAAVGNGPGLDEIRVATNMTHSGVIAPIVNHSVHVRGGYSDCSDTTPSGRTTLGGTSSGANGTFSTSGTDAAHTLVLENLQLRDGSGGGRRGGALRVEGRFAVELRNVQITSNSATRGGGAYVDGSDGAALVITDNSVISGNTATLSGGGLYCQDGGTVLLVSGAILDNLAEDGSPADPAESGNGGGAALYDCSMVQAAQGGVGGVNLNRAERDGGGYYLRNGAALTLSGDASAPASILSNTAANGGGGLAINDPLPVAPSGTSTASIFNSWIDSNDAPFGAGIGLMAGGNVLMQRTLAGAACHDATYCSSLSFNDKRAVDSTCFGAGAFVAEGSRLRLYNTFVEENCPSDAGWTFRQRLDSRLEIDSSVIARNGGAQVFFLDGSGVTSGGSPGFSGLQQVAWSTITGHNESLRTSMFVLPGFSSSTGTLRVYGTLLGEPFLQMTSVGGGGSPPPMTLDFDCLLIDALFEGSSATIRSSEAPPPYGMTAPASGNHAPSGPTASMVDLCDASRGARVAGDVLGRSTISDAPRANLYGPRDVGAYELVVAPAGGAIFADGFESG